MYTITAQNNAWWREDRWIITNVMLSKGYTENIITKKEQIVHY